MPLGKFQSDVLRVPSAQRSPDSYIAGGVAINREGPRFSGDIDIFPDSEARLEAAAKADAAALTAAGYTVRWERVREGKRDAMVARGGEAMPLEWVTDAAFRFFPTQPANCLGMCCIRLTWRPTRRQQCRWHADPAIPGPRVSGPYTQ